MRSFLRLAPLHARIFDTDLFREKRHLLLEPAVLAFETDAFEPAVGRPAAGVGRGALGQRDDMEHGRPDAPGPNLGERDSQRVCLHFEIASTDH